jgi:hypothetical protein
MAGDFDMNIKPHDLFTKNGKDFRVHKIQESEVYGVLYYSKDRGKLNPETSDFAFICRDIDEFLAEEPERVETGK